jgi:branched-chain amino acid transport system ATP-binding protein
MPPILEARRLEAHYGWTKALHGVDFAVEERGITTVLGANGAGKTTTLRAVCNMVKTAGEIRFGGRRIDGLATEGIVRMGIAHVPEGRGTFVALTVEENLRLGAYARGDRADHARELDRVYRHFPVLRERRRQQAGTLSGGEQQMLAIARALMLGPRLLLLDEPSLGLAPLLVDEIFDIIRRLNRDEKLTVLLVEQNAAMALTIADHGYVMENGRIVLEGPAASLRENADVKEFYLGLTDVGARKSYRDVKHYKRRKRWLS